MLRCLTAGMTVMMCAIAANAAIAAPRPNVLFIISDDQGWNDIGYHGSDVLTPHLDRLAKTGVRLEANYVYPSCSPTRAGVLTGRNPSRFGILGPIGGRSPLVLPPETLTLADLFKSAGYRTAMTGKWHLSLRPEAGPRQYGFDSTHGYLHGQVDPYRDHLYKNGDRTWHRNDEFTDEEGHATDLITNEAVRVIEQNSEQPFFLYVAYSVPHYPLEEPDDYLAKYEGRIDDPDRRMFAASLTHMDAGIGRIIEALDRTGQRDNTLILFTSDNGGQKSWTPRTEYGGRFAANKVLGNNQPFRGWKVDLYEGGIRVPAFLNWPAGLQRPSSIVSPTCAMDWLPTLADILGIELQDDLKLDGESFWPMLAAHASSARQPRTFYWKTRTASAVRVGDWKLIEHHGKRPRHELFNLADDPYEEHELASEQPQKVEELKAALKQQQSLDRN